MINKIKKIVDILMIIMFIVMMGYHITGNSMHEILGVMTFTLFITHNILNIRWYKTILKGKYNFRRTFQLIINFSLFIAMICMMISGIMISSNVFSFLGIKTTMFGRNLHLISTSWGFVLMAIHLGLHLHIILFKLNKKMKESTFEYIYYLIIIILMIFGLYTFINSGLWKDMLLVSQFKFFDYDQNPAMFYIGEFSIVCLISFATYLIFDVFRKKKKCREKVK